MISVKVVIAVGIVVAAVVEALIVWIGYHAWQERKAKKEAENDYRNHFGC